MSFWQDKRVTVTGGAGFLGSYLIPKLKKRGPKDIFVPLIKNYDIRKEKDIKAIVRRSKARHNNTSGCCCRRNRPQHGSSVIPALIKKCFDAVMSKSDSITAWGSGKPIREFIYVEDAAEAIALAAEKYNKPEPVNIGTISIKELTHLIAKLCGFKGKIIWDASKPDGQPERRLDVTKAKKEFGFRAKMGLEEGLKKTIKWYKNSID